MFSLALSIPMWTSGRVSHEVGLLLLASRHSGCPGGTGQRDHKGKLFHPEADGTWGSSSWPSNLQGLTRDHKLWLVHGCTGRQDVRSDSNWLRWRRPSGDERIVSWRPRKTTSCSFGRWTGPRTARGKWWEMMGNDGKRDTHSLAKIWAEMYGLLMTGKRKQCWLSCKTVNDSSWKHKTQQDNYVTQIFTDDTI